MGTDPTRIGISFDPTERRMQGVTAHGNRFFDVPFISEVETSTPFKLWQGGCSNGLCLPSHIKHVVSLYPWERYSHYHDLDSFVEVRMYDSHGGADFPQAHVLAEWINVCLQTGDTLVHCQAGLNRSGLVASLALMKQGLSASDAIARLRAARSEAVLCNRSFEQYLLDVDRLTDN